jgi:hypothetical protein
MTPDLIRVGPVYFQSLESELAPVVAYLTGHVIDAGCGSRDISSHLLAAGARQVTRYDLGSDDPDVVVGPLEQMPFDDSSFDNALCNAVLEHVGDVERSMAELARVVRPGGHLVVTVPFLQPYHPCPGDYRRYTADGLCDLGRRAGLEVVAVLPVHSFAQTLGWLLWQHAQEGGGRIRQRLAWGAASVVSRMSYRTDHRRRSTANTFQAVFRRRLGGGEAVLGEWTAHAVPEPVGTAPTMLIPDEIRLLHHLAEHVYTGSGCIVDCGAFLGGSTIALADGLRRGLAALDEPERRLIHSFDRFEVEEYMRGDFFPVGTPVGTSFRDRFEATVRPYRGLIEVHPGDVTERAWSGEPIELLFIDVAKDPSVCDWVTRTLFPHLLPGRSIVVQQDYLFESWTAWLHVTMEHLADHFEYVCDTGQNSVVFRHTRPIPPERIAAGPVATLPRQEQQRLMDRAAARFPPAQRALLHASHQQYREILDAA